MQPYLKIIEQPQGYYRFRYETENKYPHLHGESNNHDNVTYPTVELKNYNCEARIKCDVYRVDKEEKHYHQVIHNEENVILNQDSYTYCFREKSVIVKTRNEVLQYLKEVYKRRYPDYNSEEIGRLCKKGLSEDVLNKFRLRFSVHDLDTDKEICSVYSQPILNMRSTSTNKLKITWCSLHSGEATGRTEVGLFTDKISRNGIEIHIKEETEDGRDILLGKGDIVEVHRSCAVRFRMPSYYNRDITEPVKVFIQLVRIKCGSTSNKIEFTYTPTPNNYRKRKCTRKEAFSSIFRQKNSSAEPIYQTSASLPNLSTTAQLRQARKPYQKSIDTQKKTISINSSDISPRNNYQILDIPIQIDPTYATQALTPPNSCTSNENDDIQNIMGQIQLCENGFVIEENGLKIPVNYEPLDTLKPEIEIINIPPEYYLQNQMPDWMPESDVNTQSMYDPTLGQNPVLSPPAGTSSQEFADFDFDMGEFINLDTWKTDGGGTKKTETQTSHFDLENKMKKNKSEPSAFFNPQDITKVKKLIKEIYEKLRVGRKDEVRDTIEELSEIRLTDGGTFLHMMTETNQEKLKVIVNSMGSMNMLEILNLTNDFGQTILHAAILNNHPQLASFLLAKGCDPKLADYEGNNAIHCALKYDGHCLESLLSAIKENNIAFDLNARNFEHQTALHLAAILDSGESVELLVRAGADTLSADSAGRTALHLAAYDRCVRAAQALLITGIVDEIDDSGRSALQIVCDSNYTEKSSEMIKLLLRHEADPFKPSRNGNSAVDYAKSNPQMWHALKKELINVKRNSTSSDSEDEYFSADEDLDTSEDLASKLQEMTLSEHQEIRDSSDI